MNHYRGRSVETMRTPALTHRVYSHTIRLLTERNVTPIEAVEPLAHILLPDVKMALEAEGVARQEILEAEDQIIDALEGARNWSVRYALPKTFFNGQSKEWRVDPEVLIENRIVPVPNETMNAIICAQLSDLFSEGDLLSIPGFVLKRIEGYDQDESPIYRVHLDLKPRSHGFIVPLFDHNRLIKALRVFRHRNDERPFILRSLRVEAP